MPQPLNLSPDLSQPLPGADAALASGWTWKAARAACDAHKRGTFELSWQLALDAPSSPAIRGAEAQRLAPPCGLPWEVIGSRRAPGRIETEAAQDLWDRHLRRLLRSSLRDIAYMGFSVWQHPTATNPTTLRREVITVERWPLSQVRFTATPFMDPWQPGRWIFGYYALQFGVGESLGQVLYDPASPTSGVAVKFIQLPRAGETDGHWTVLGEGDMPHMNGAITSLDTPYVGGQVAPRARANLLKMYGRQSPLAEMPPDTATTSPEGVALGKVVNGIGIDRDGGLLPNGAKVHGFSLVNPTAGLFMDDAQLTSQAVALALLGRGGSLVKEDAQYPSPIEAEVPESLVRADVEIIERGASRLFNFLAAQNTPKPGKIILTGHLPNTEQDAAIKARQEREKREAEKLSAFHNAITLERANGFDLVGPDGQARLNAIAARCGVEAPIIPATGLPPVLVKVPPPTVPIDGAGAVPLPSAPKEAPSAAPLTGGPQVPEKPVSGPP